MDLELPKQLGAAFFFFFFPLAQPLQTKPLGQVTGPLFLKLLVEVRHLASALGQTLPILFCKSDPNASTREYSK